MRWAVLLLPGLVLAACGAEVAPEASGPDRSEAGQLPPWRPVADVPLAPRSGAVIGWTGEEILVVGGSTDICHPAAGCAPSTEPPFRDGAVLDPSSGTWRSIADAPVPVPPDQPTAALDDDVFILVSPWASGTPELPTLLRYRADDDAWTADHLPSSAGAVLPAGDALVLYPTSDEGGEAPDLRFDPSTRGWSQLPDDPLSPSFDRTYAWDGADLYLFAKDITPSPGGASGPALVNAAVLDEDGWRELPTGEVLGFGTLIADADRIVAPALGCADGGEVNNYGRCIPFGAVLDTETGTWSDLPDAPSHGEKGVFSAGALTADELLLTGLGQPMIDLTTNTWFVMPAIDVDEDDDTTAQRTYAGAGPYGFAFGGARFDTDGFDGELLGDAWLWTPPTLVGSPR